MILVGIAISFLLESLVQHQPRTKPDHGFFYGIMASVVITIIVWEGNLLIDAWMNRKFPWMQKPMRRLMVHLPVSIVYSAVTIFLSMIAFNLFICELPFQSKHQFMRSSVIVGVLVSIILLSIEVGAQFFGHWKRSLVEVEKYKAESLQAQLQNLKDQVNPHFLFNNMSVLSSLVYKDQDKAVDFINQLSKVYRYVLDNRGSELVTLESELTFIRSYTYLLQIRFDTSIIFDVRIPDSHLRYVLPPMSLQLLIENAIKHNEVSSDQPLTVKVRVKDDYLVVRNNLQLRTGTGEPGSKTGLQNIKARYTYFTDKPIEVIQDNAYFIVKIPLLVSA